MIKKLLLSAIIVIFPLTKPLLASNDYPINLLIPLNHSQNSYDYLPPNFAPNKSLLTEAQEKQNQIIFAERYFFPWSKQNLQTTFCLLAKLDDNTCNNTVDIEQGAINAFKDKIKYDQHYQPYDMATWISKISENMDLAHLPNEPCGQQQCYGITVQNALIRVLPSHQPFFSDPHQPGEAYPFDYLQLFNSWIGTPVQIVQHTVDQKWYLIKSQGVLGWVPEGSVARVDASFINQWKKSQLATLIQREFKIGNNKTLYLGSLLPFINATNEEIGIPVKGNGGYALLQTVKLDKYVIRPWPLSTTPDHFSLVINALKGMPYGWGGLHFNSDCSALVLRVLNSFAIWLPRNSSFQAKFGGMEYSLANMSIDQRKAWFTNNAPEKLLPYLTLISFGSSATSVSHIGLYLGAHDDHGTLQAFIFNSAWGLPILPLNTPDKSVGRAIVGKASIMPLNFGEDLVSYFNTENLTTTILWEKPGFNVTLLNVEPTLALTRLRQPLPLSTYYSLDKE